MLLDDDHSSAAEETKEEDTDTEQVNDNSNTSTATQAILVNAPSGNGSAVANAPDTPSLINNLTRLITGGHELGREGNQLLNETSGTATAQSTSTPRRQLSFPQGNDFGSRVATNFANFITSPRAGEAVREAARNLFTPTPAIQNETNQATIQQGQGGEAGAVAVAANDNANEQGGVEGGALVVGAANEGAVAAEGGKFTLLVRTSYVHLLTMFHFYSKHKS